MPNPVLSPLTGTLAPVNAELEKIVTSLTSKLDRNPSDGQANQIEKTLDANNQRIINLPQPASPNDPARLKDVSAAIATGLPDQTGNQNKVLETNGTSASWATKDLSLVTNNASSTLTRLATLTDVTKTNSSSIVFTVDESLFVVEDILRISKTLKAGDLTITTTSNQIAPDGTSDTQSIIKDGAAGSVELKYNGTDWKLRIYL